VTDRAELFLGIIAFATAAVAIGQLCVVVVTGIAARRVARLADTVEHELKPIFGHLNAIGRDASRATSLATAQVERVDQLFADLVVRIDRLVNSVQSSVEGPAREGRALLAAFRAAFEAIREIRQGRAQPRGDDEDALFI
jgi:hypothetical protein